MRRPLLTFWLSLVWLIASPSFHLPDTRWVEVGAPNAAAQSIMVDPIQVAPSKKTEAKKPVKKKRVGSSGLVVSTQPGFHPMRKIKQPDVPSVTGTIVTPARDPRYPNVPTVPAILPETSQDRIIRCTHQGNLGGLSGGQQGSYVHNCAF